MCELSVIAGAALSLAQTGAQLQGQRAQHKAQQQANARHAEAIRASTIANYDALQSRRDQERDASSQKLIENQRDALRARERALVSAGEAGVSGLSVDALMRDLGGRSAEFSDAVQLNYENFSDQVQRDLDQQERGAASQLRALPDPTPPDYLGAGVRAGVTLVDAFGSRGEASARQARRDAVSGFTHGMRDFWPG